ncbi:GyrI-like domain-containing protein [Flagellimonas sp. DF-77]|uniref:GyrI-like domain-containing protein n=1 Tax=Flagellimonas algarum TaxID=3230298 RepID=UPI0033949FFB
MEIEAFDIIGISTRTTNANGQSAVDVERLWGRFWGEEIQNKIPNALNEEIYAVYTDYESDYQGAYTMIIGCAVSSVEEVPEGMVAHRIARDTYEKFVSKGPMPQAILATWMDIWQNDATLNRAYRADFTVHGKKYFDGDQAEVETFLSIKNP